jgi:hydroxymethylpyrimidine pyrophosphatase-like HAD family hydrolase
MGGDRDGRGGRDPPGRRHPAGRDLDRPLSTPTYRLLALDIDGTLLGNDKTISPRNRAAIDGARAAGVHVVLVTGRRYPAARRVAEQLGGEVDLVLHNGALIVEAGSRAAQPGAARTRDGAWVVRCRPLAHEVAKEAIAEGLAQGADPVVHCGLQGEGQLLVQGVAPSNTLLVYYLDKSHPDVVTVKDVAKALSGDPLQVMFGGAMADMARVLPPLQERLGSRARIERTVYPAMGVGILDVLTPEVGKAEALRFLQARWGLGAQETLAVGDNWNDHEMLQAAGLGFVMGNADPEMLQLGLPVLPRNDEDGVAVAVERHILQK